VPGPSAHKPEIKLDIRGILLFGICLLGFVYGIGQVQNGLSDPGTWIPLAIGILGLLAFVPRERRQREPALELTLFLVPAFSIALLADAVFNFYSGGFGVLAPRRRDSREEVLVDAGRSQQACTELSH
jgi:drug/metabolite transporter (DMT)-like permease